MRNENVQKALTDTGLVGALLLSLVFGSGILMGIRNAGRGKLESAVWAAVLAALATVSFFGFPLRIPIGDLRVDRRGALHRT